MALQTLIAEFGEHLEELNEREKLLLIQIIALDSAPKPLLLDLIATLAAQIKG